MLRRFTQRLTMFHPVMNRMRIKWIGTSRSRQREEAFSYYRDGLMVEGYPDTIEEAINGGFGLMAISNYLLYERARDSFNLAREMIESSEIDSVKLAEYRDAIDCGMRKVEFAMKSKYDDHIGNHPTYHYFDERGGHQKFDDWHLGFEGVEGSPYI